jgi:hypothetical protein
MNDTPTKLHYNMLASRTLKSHVPTLIGTPFNCNHPAFAGIRDAYVETRSVSEGAARLIRQANGMLVGESIDREDR